MILKYDVSALDAVGENSERHYCDTPPARGHEGARGDTRGHEGTRGAILC